VIDFICKALLDIHRLCHALRKANGNGEDWQKILVENKEVRQAIHHQLDGQKVLQVLLQCYTTFQP
jgi:hypothetical protein